MTSRFVLLLLLLAGLARPCLASPRNLQSAADEDRCAGTVEGYSMVPGSWTSDQGDASGRLSQAGGVEDCAAQCTSMRLQWTSAADSGTGHNCSGFNFAERGSVCRLLDLTRGGEMRLRPQDVDCPYRGACYCLYTPVEVAPPPSEQPQETPSPMTTPPLPATETCEDWPASVLELPCLPNSATSSGDQGAESLVLIDASAESHVLELHGHAHVAVDGLHLDGEGDFVVVRDPYAYAEDATFSVSLWLTKPRSSGGCSGGIYEYLFSQAGAVFPNPIDGSQSPTVGIYIGCDCGCSRDCLRLSPQNTREHACHGWSSASGTIIRHNLVDDVGHTAIFDFPLSSSGDFDMVTAVWIHTVMVVTPPSVVTYDDGSRVLSDVYGYFAPDGVIRSTTTNPAYPDPNHLTASFVTFTLNNELVVGGRHDLDADRHFQGRMAMIQVFDGALDAVQVRCLFNIGEAYLPEITTALQAFQDHPATRNTRRVWCWDYTYRLADARAENLEGCAVLCLDTLGCLSFDYHEESYYCKLNTISMAGALRAHMEGAFADAPTGVVHFDILPSHEASLSAATSTSNSSIWVPTEASACPMREESCAYNWIELSMYGATNRIEADMWEGTDHSSDDGWYNVDLGWTFMWYGLAERLITIGSNGLVTFGTSQLDYGGTEPVPCRAASEACIRAASTRHGVDGLIAVFWTDLDPGAGGNVSYALEHPHTAEAAMVIEWSHTAYFCQQQCDEPQPTATFELILYPSGQVVMQYQDVGAEYCNARNRGQHPDGRCVWSEVSIGWEDQSGTRGGQIMYDEWPAPRTAYSIPECAHSGDHVPPALVQSTGGWSTHPSGDVRFWPYFGASCTSAPLAVVCAADTLGAQGCTASMAHAPLWSSALHTTSRPCEPDDSLCACAMACIDQMQDCGGFSMPTNINSSVCTLYAHGACSGSNLRLDRLYPSTVYVAREDGTHGLGHGADSAESEGQATGTRPWTGKAIRELEPVILGCCVIILLILVGRTIAPVKGRSVSDSVDAWYAARQDMRPQVRTDVGPRSDMERRMATRGAGRPSSVGRTRDASRVEDAPPGGREHPRPELPPPPRPPMFMFGAGGGGDGGATGGGSAGSRRSSTGESLENPLADQGHDDL